MPRLAIRTPRNTYTGYSIGCAAVWGAILLVGRRRMDARSWKTLRLVCGGWWTGWTSATIARIGYPPPKQLTPTRERRLRRLSIALIAAGLASTLRLLAGKPSPEDTPRA